MKSLSSILFAVLFFSHTDAQQAGSLDMSFGDGGVAVTSLPQGYEYGNLQSVLITDDDKIISLGTFYTGSQNNYTDLGLMRHLQNGELDTSFGSGGIVSIGLSNFASNADFLKDAILQSDGKIVCVGSMQTSTSKQAMIVRLEQNGELDSTFGEQGLTDIEISPQNDEANAVALDSSGRFILGIETSEGNGGVVARLNQSGELDASFGNSGLSWVSHVVRDIVLDNSRGIIALGQKYVQGQWGFAATRIESSGIIDQSFASNGVAFFIYPDNYQSMFATSVTIQSNGRILVGGSVQTVLMESQMAICRLLGNGTPDLTFGIDGGTVLSDISGHSVIRDIKSTVNGTIYAVGTAEQNLTDLAIVAFTPDGNLETSFADSGLAYFDINQSPDEAYALQVLNDGNLVVGGITDETSEYYTFCLAKILSSPNLGLVSHIDNSFESFIYPNPIENQATLQFELKNSERLTFSLFDMNGKLIETFVSEADFKAGKHELQLSIPDGLESGTYLLSVQSDKGQTGVRLIKR